MQIWKQSDTCRTIGVLLFDAFSNHCLANAVEPLRAANTLARKQLYRWQFLSIDGAVVTSSSGLPVKPELALGRHPGGDCLFVMPSYDFDRHATVACTRALRAARRRFGVMAGFDMGSWLLASAGLLDGRRATIHWDEMVKFAERFPEVQVVDDRVALEGDVMSCGGASTSFELVLEMIGQQHGPMLRLEVEALFTYGNSDLPGPAGRPLRRDRFTQGVIALMRRNIEVPLTVEEIAAQMGLSRKGLERDCNARFGFGPRRLYRAVRLREARRLLESTDLSVEEISGRSGYRNSSAMTRAFREEFGMAPVALRRMGGSLKNPMS